MRRGNKKHNYSKVFFHPIFVSIIGFCILTYISIPIIRNAQKQRQLNNEIKELEKEVAKYEGNNSDLKKMINYLKSDQYTLEQARLNLNYKKNEEGVVVIKNLENADKMENTKQVFNINEEKKENNLFKNSNVYKWWLFFAKI